MIINLILHLILPSLCTVHIHPPCSSLNSLSFLATLPHLNINITHWSCRMRINSNRTRPTRSNYHLFLHSSPLSVFYAYLTRLFSLLQLLNALNSITLSSSPLRSSWSRSHQLSYPSNPFIIIVFLLMDSNLLAKMFFIIFNEHTATLTFYYIYNENNSIILIKR